MDTKAMDKEMDQVKADIADLRDDMATLLRTMKEIGMAEGQELYDRAYERSRHAGERVRERAGEAYAAIGREVEERPLTSVLTAFATGFVVGMILDRRR